MVTFALDHWRGEADVAAFLMDSRLLQNATG
jgi:hypothetical protein